jgi:hypothetical protein
MTARCERTRYDPGKHQTATSSSTLENGNSLIEVDRLGVSYCSPYEAAHRALDNISFRISAGEGVGLVSLSFDERGQLYGRVQDLVADNLPIICLASPHVLVGVNRRVQNVRPSILRPYALWNAGALFLEGPADNR